MRRGSREISGETSQVAASHSLTFLNGGRWKRWADSSRWLAIHAGFTDTLTGCAVERLGDWGTEIYVTFCYTFTPRWNPRLFTSGIPTAGRRVSLPVHTLKMNFGFLVRTVGEICHAGRSTVKLNSANHRSWNRRWTIWRSMRIMKGLTLLTVKMLLLGSNHLLRGGLTDGFGEALAGDAVPRG